MLVSMTCWTAAYNSGDCMVTNIWRWDGSSLVHTEEATTGMCRDIAGGGAWDLPTLVTAVRKQR